MPDKPTVYTNACMKHKTHHTDILFDWYSLPLSDACIEKCNNGKLKNMI